MGRTPPPVEGMYTLKVDNLSFDCTARDLHSLFNRYGEVGDIYIPRHRNASQNRGFGFVRFLDKRDANDAMDSMHGARFQGRELRIDVAKYKRPEINRFAGGGGHYSRGFGGANSFYGGSSSSGRRRSRSRSRSRSRDRRRSRSRSRDRRRSRSRSRSPSRSRSRSRNSRRRSRTPRRSRSSSRGRENGDKGSADRSPKRESADRGSRSASRDRSPRGSRSRSRTVSRSRSRE